MSWDQFSNRVIGVGLLLILLGVGMPKTSPGLSFLLLLMLLGWLVWSVRNLEVPTRKPPKTVSRAKPRRAYRPSVSQKVRQRVFRRDGGQCQVCGARRDLEIDHIIPLSRGGSNTAKNLQVLCATCNRRKGNRYVG